MSTREKQIQERVIEELNEHDYEVSFNDESQMTYNGKVITSAELMALLNEARKYGSESRVGTLDQLRNRASRVGSDDGWSAADEDAAWSLMTMRY